MNFLNSVPWNQVALHLRDQVEQLSGVQGALVGAGMGAATSLAAMTAASRKIDVPTLLAGVAVGIAYGASDKARLAEPGRHQ